MALADMRCVASRYLLMYVRSGIAVERVRAVVTVTASTSNYGSLATIYSTICHIPKWQLHSPKYSAWRRLMV